MVILQSRKLLDKLYMFSVVSINAKNKWHIGYFTEIYEEVLASASYNLKHENSKRIGDLSLENNLHV